MIFDLAVIALAPGPAASPRAEIPCLHFEFRAVRPVFYTTPFEVCGRAEGDRQIKLWARTPEGHVAMDASATLV